MSMKYCLNQKGSLPLTHNKKNKINLMSDFNEIINSEKPTLVDFYATWCGPCKTLTPILESAAKELSGEAKIVKVDIDKNMDAARKYNVRSVPTLILFKEGKEVWRQSGVSPQSLIVENVKKII